MTVKSNNALAIAAVSDWIKNLAPVFQPMRSETNRTTYALFSRALNKIQVIGRNSDWFIARFAPVVISRRNYFGIGFPKVT